MQRHDEVAGRCKGGARSAHSSHRKNCRQPIGDNESDLRIVGKSTWLAVIAHGVFNWWWNLFMAFTLATSPLAFEYLAGESGLLTIAAVALSAFVLIRRMENPARGLLSGA
jgi:hypothetical protein